MNYVASHIADATIQNYVYYYGWQGWNRNFILNALQPVAAWARQYNRIVTVNEFGVYRPYAPAAARSAWIRDVRSVFEEHGIGWTMWELDQGFGLFAPGLNSSIALTNGRTLDTGNYAALISPTCSVLNSTAAIASESNVRSAFCPVNHSRSRHIFTHYLPWYNSTSAQRNGWCQAGGSCSDGSSKQYTAAPLIGEYDQVLVLGDFRCFLLY